MKSKVFMIKTGAADTVDAVKEKLALLIDKSNVLSCVEKGDSAAVKIHFGEAGNTGFVDPRYAGVICRAAAQKGALPFLSDTNTLYGGRRTNSADHRQLALEHGFTPAATGAELDIPDDRAPGNTVEIPVNLTYIKTATIALPYIRANALIGIAHFKGHLLTGFGGALKNIGMGCATRKGKLAQHSDVAPFVVTAQCTGCNKCVEICPVKAIVLKDGKSFVDATKCIGCASCIAACKFQAINLDWEGGGKRAPSKVVEYAKAVLDRKKGKTAFFNFAVHITAECDCLAKDDPSIVPDVGILASSDPVAIDKASYDLCVQKAGSDVFELAHPHRDGVKQLEYAASLDLGSLDYELIEV
jgi:uncharacterized protein